MDTKRMERVSRELQREISQIIMHELNDPRVGLVSITKVKLASDLRTAQVFVSMLGNKPVAKNTLDCLDHARGYIQKIICERMELRFTPVLSFHYDRSIEEQCRISELLDKDISKEEAI